jgi:hypothetical protein
MANTVTIQGALSAYTEVHRDELLVKASLGGVKTFDYIDIMPGVKNKELIPMLDSTVVFSGATCGWNPNGTDVFSEKYIEVKPLEVEKEFCDFDFQKSFANNQLMIEAGRETLPFEQKITESNINATNEALEALVWRGDSGLGISGFTELISAATASIKVDFPTGSTMISKIDSIVASVPVKALRKGVNIFLSYTDYRAYIAELNSSCCANRPIVDAAQDAIKYVGDSRIQIVPVMGLEKANSGDTAYIVAASADALVYATDLENSHNVVRWWFDEKESKHDFRILFNAGTALRWDDETVVGA